VWNSSAPDSFRCRSSPAFCIGSGSEPRD
jgi:hypothetical protein